MWFVKITPTFTDRMKLLTNAQTSLVIWVKIDYKPWGYEIVDIEMKINEYRSTSDGQLNI